MTDVGKKKNICLRRDECTCSAIDNVTFTQYTNSHNSVTPPLEIVYLCLVIPAWIYIKTAQPFLHGWIFSRQDLVYFKVL